MDVLSSVLVGLEPRGRVFCRGSVTAPWAISGGAATPLFHAVVAGGGFARFGDADPVPVRAGDLVLLIRGGAHVLADDPATAPVPLTEAVCRIPDRQVGELSVEGGGAATTIICGYFDFVGAADHPLINALPDMLIVNCGLARWLDVTLGLLYDELRADRPGSELVAARLTDILLVAALRAHIEQHGAEQRGFLGALSDPQVGQALALIHTRPEQGWRAAALAERVGMSRSAFFARFNDLIGEPPARYVTRVGMQRAAQWLGDPGASPSVAELARRLGYGSESAFSRAFARFHGSPPSAFRRPRITAP